MALDHPRMAMVRVFSPSGDRRGTGYVVGPRAILTAKHVLTGTVPGQHGRAADTLPEGTKITIELGFLGIMPISISTEKIWLAQNRDIAVLQCGPINGIPQEPVLFSPMEPRANDPWESGGFPQVAEQDPQRAYRAPAGMCGGKSDGGRIELQPGAKPIDNGGWKGISGAPLFVTGHPGIAGVICVSVDGFGNELLLATLLGPMLADQGFREAVGVPATRAPQMDRAARIAAILQQGALAEPLRRGFAAQIWGDADAAVQPQAIAAVLLQYAQQPNGHDRLGALIFDAGAQLRKDECMHEGLERHPLLEILYTALPHASASSPVEIERDHATELELFRVENVMEILAESQLAHHDGRACEFAVGNKGEAIGERASIIGPDPGFRRHTEFGQLVDYLADVLEVHDSNSEKRLDNVRGALQQERDDHREGRNRAYPYYLVIEHKSGRIPPIVDVLRSQLPELRVVLLAVDIDGARRRLEIMVVRRVESLIKEYA